MPLLTKPAAYVDTTVWAASDVNALLNALYDNLGSSSASPGGGTNQGTLDWQNLALAAQIRNTQVADTAMVLGTAISGVGTQTVLKKTAFSAGSFNWDTSVNNRAAPGALTAAATTIAGGKANQVFAVYAGAALPITAFLADANVQVGDVFEFVFDTTGASGAVTLTHTSANATGNIKMRGGASLAIAAGTRCSNRFLWGDLNASGFNQWWEM